MAGNAWYAAIDNVVRAVGRIVVCVDAAADVSTAMMRILSRLLPSTCEPIAANTSSLLSSSTWGPAKASVAVETIPYVASRMTVEITAARPGVLAGSLVSSLTETALSQPQ